MLVDLDWLEMVKSRFTLINAQELTDIKFMRDGEEVKFSAKDKEEFEFMGLANKDFPEMFKCIKEK